MSKAVYFNNEKQASYEKYSDTIAQVSIDTWMQFNVGDIGVTWDIINGEFVDLRGTVEYIAKKEQKARRAKISQIKALLNELDLKSIRALRGGQESDIKQLAEIESLAVNLRNDLSYLSEQTDFETMELEQEQQNYEN